MNYSTMNEKAYECFELYFKYVNALSESITLLKNNEFKIKSSSEFHGIECLWNIAIES